MRDALKIRVIVLQRILPHYRKDFFKKLREIFNEMKIIYGQPYPTEPLDNADKLDKEYYFKKKNYYFNYFNYFNKAGKIFLSGIYSEILKTRPDVIITGFNAGNLNVYVLFFLKIFMRYRLILWSFGYDPFAGFSPDKRFIDKVRLYFYQNADAVIFYWEEGRKIVADFSKHTGHYFVAPNTLDTTKQLELKSEFDKAGKEKLKNELGVTEKFHFVYVGRLLDIKQTDLLLKAFGIIEIDIRNCRLTIIGDGPESGRLKLLSEELKLKNIKFKGEILDDEITGKWIYLSDAFVMPGRLGLSVVHSFCYGTPVISMLKKDPYHSEGIGYIKNGMNGFLVEDGNYIEIAEKMKTIILNPELSDGLRMNAVSTAKNDASVGKMLEGFENAVGHAKNKSD